jgi:xanthine dehydrogenase accessory factor
MTPGALRDAALGWQAAGRAAVVVQVLSARGSVPRDAGTRMLVSLHEVLGTLGGGHLELQAITTARQLLADGRAAHDQQVALGPTLGQCCGGVLTLRFTPLADADLAAWPAPAPRFDLQLHGAGHVGRAIVTLLRGIECRVRWIDPRDDQFPQSPLPLHIEAVCADPAHAEVAQAAPGAFYLVLTHSHDLDLDISRAILQRGDFGFFGLIGSQTKRARFESRLAQRGVPADLLARMVCPIGINGLRGKEPEVLAVAVVAQLLMQAQADQIEFK